MMGSEIVPAVAARRRRHPARAWIGWCVGGVTPLPDGVVL